MLCNKYSYILYRLYDDFFGNFKIIFWIIWIFKKIMGKKHILLNVWKPRFGSKHSVVFKKNKKQGSEKHNHELLKLYVIIRKYIGVSK